MKKILFLLLITITTLVADNLLKEGRYSWYGGGSFASLTVKKDKANGYGSKSKKSKGSKSKNLRKSKKI